MSNRLMPISEVVASIKAELDKLSPAEQWASLYCMQTTLGSFPKDKAEEGRISAALRQEKRNAGL